MYSFTIVFVTIRIIKIKEKMMNLVELKDEVAEGIQWFN